MPDQSDIAVVQELYRAFAAADMDTVLRLVHPEIVVVEASSLPYGGRWEGVDEYMRLLAKLSETWSQFDVSNMEYAIGDNFIVCILSVAMTSRATGKKIEIRASEYWKVRDGRVVHIEPIYSDTYAARLAIESP